MISRVIRKIRFLILKSRIISFDSLRTNISFQKINPVVLVQSKESLQQFYQHYVTKISRADMAASLELSALINALCHANDYKKLLDLGSGFSSFVLRNYSKLRLNSVVYSVDDDILWLERTREYLINSSVSTENLMMLSEFIDSNENQFDIVLLDLNFVDVRKNYINLAVERCKAGGLIFFDDVHKQEFMTEVLSQTKNLPIDVFNIKNISIDGFGRFALVAVKKI